MTLSRRDLLRASGAATAGALAGCSGLPFGGGDASTDVQWAVTGGDASRTFTTPVASIPADRPSASWQAPLEGPFGSIVLGTADRALAATPVGVHAVSLADGSIPWRAPFAVQGGGSDFVLSEEGVHVRRFFPNGARGTSRYGLSIADGSRTYDHSSSFAGSALWAPTTDGLYGLSGTGTVSRYDPASGQWGDSLVETGGEIWGTVTDGDRLYMPVNRSGSWAVEAYDLPGGGQSWSRSLPWGGAVSMLTTDDTLVMTNVPDVGGSPGATAHDPATGEDRWEFTWDDSSLVPWRAVAAGGTVYLMARPAGQDGGSYRLAAVDVASGEVRWRADTDLQFPFAVTGDRLVGTTITQQFPAPGLVAIDADGSEAWRLQPGQGVEPGIAVDDGVLAFVATGQGRELALFA